MSVFRFYEITEPVDPVEVEIVYAFSQIIPSLDIIDKFTELHSIVFVNCTMKYEDIVNYDFSKFKHLKNFVFVGNSTNKKHINLDTLASIINKELFLHNIDCARAIINYDEDIVFKVGEFKYQHGDKIDELEKEYLKSKLILYMTFEKFKKKYNNISQILFKYQKELFDYNYQIESKIPLNKSILNIPLIILCLSSYYIVPFFDLLPTTSSITATLESLIFDEFSISVIDFMHSMFIPIDFTFCRMFTHKYYQYVYSRIKQNKISLKLEHNKIVFDNDPICKFLLFKKMNNCYGGYTNLSIFQFLACDTLELCKPEKDRPTVELENIINNLVMYYGDLCYYYDFCNAYITFKTNIAYIYAHIIRYQQLNMHHKQKELLVMTAMLPHKLKTLNINFINEYHDNTGSSSSANNYIFNKLPSSLKNLTLINVANDMKIMIKKMNLSCKKTIVVDMTNEYEDKDNSY